MKGGVAEGFVIIILENQLPIDKTSQQIISFLNTI